MSDTSKASEEQVLERYWKRHQAAIEAATSVGEVKMAIRDLDQTSPLHRVAEEKIVELQLSALEVAETYEEVEDIFIRSPEGSRPKKLALRKLRKIVIGEMDSYTLEVLAVRIRYLVSGSAPRRRAMKRALSLCTTLELAGILEHALPMFGDEWHRVLHKMIALCRSMSSTHFFGHISAYFFFS